jgi:hypothetical protein
MIAIEEAERIIHKYCRIIGYEKELVKKLSFDLCKELGDREYRTLGNTLKEGDCGLFYNIVKSEINAHFNEFFTKYFILTNA